MQPSRLVQIHKNLPLLRPVALPPRVQRGVYIYKIYKSPTLSGGLPFNCSLEV